MKKNILLEGKPGVGKTTIIHQVALKLSFLQIGGFYTEEIRCEGQRAGFRIRAFDGRSGTLAHISFKGEPRVGKYGVDIVCLEQIGVPALRQALQNSDVIIIDEIGKMELFSRQFQKAVLQCLNSNKPVLATVMLRAHPFVDKLKMRSDVQLIRVTLENRNELPEKIKHLIAHPCQRKT